MLILQAELAHHLHHCLHFLYWSIRHDPMTEIEDVPRSSRSSPQNLLDPRFDHFDRCKQNNRVEIALNRVSMTDFAPTHIERLSPVKSDHIRSRRRHLLKQSCCLNAEVDDRNSHLLH